MITLLLSLVNRHTKHIVHIIKGSDRLRLLLIEFNTDTIVRQCRVRARDGMLAAILVLEQIPGTEEEEESTENKHNWRQVQCV